jgi:ankyrin repeat protein
MIEFLKTHGFLDAYNEDGCTPLQEAAVKNEYEVAKELVENGADVNKTTGPDMDEGTGTALFYACDYNNYDVALLLLNHGAVQIADHRGETPLHVTETSKMAKLLIERGGNVHALTDKEETPLHIASNNGMKEYVELLLSIGLDMNAVSDYGTPLQMALVRGRINIVELLLEKGANFDFTQERDILLQWLKENIDEAKPGSSLKEEGLYESIETILATIPSMINAAKSGNVPLFIDKLRQGTPFYLMQVVPNMPQEPRTEFKRWALCMQRDMHHLYRLLHYKNSASDLTYPGPIAECLKQMLLLPKKTRKFLNHRVWA